MRLCQMRTMAAPAIMPAIAPCFVVRRQYRLNSVSGPNEAPKPAQAYDTTLKMTEFSSQATKQPKMSTAAEADEARQRAEAAAFVEKFCSDPKKPCFVNKTAAREMTPAFAEELYRLSRLRYLG